MVFTVVLFPLGHQLQIALGDLERPATFNSAACRLGDVPFDY
jgi:hypothetical protein